jgi:hypothetical protein
MPLQFSLNRMSKVSTVKSPLLNHRCESNVAGKSPKNAKTSCSPIKTFPSDLIQITQKKSRQKESCDENEQDSGEAN